MSHRPLRLAILGTRGIPASYGGFETFAEQLSTRLAARGHEVTVYCRSHHTPRKMRQFDGVRLVVLPSIRHKYLDTFAHTLFNSVIRCAYVAGPWASWLAASRAISEAATARRC